MLFINICLHKGGYAIDMNIFIGMDLGLLIQILGQFCYMSISTLD